MPALIVFVFGGGEQYEIWVAIFAVPAAAYALAKYVSLRYRLGGGELVVKEGILMRTERHIPYHRIQNVDTTRNLLHRLFGVADVSIQTASGAEPEAVLRVLSRDGVEAMRRHIFADRASVPGAFGTTLEFVPQGIGLTGEGPAASEPSGALTAGGVVTGSAPQALPVFAPREVEVVRCGIGELIRYGVISNRGMLALAAVLGIVWQFEFMPSEEQFRRWAQSMLGLREWTWLFTGLVVFLAVIGLIVGLRLLSIAWAVVTLYGFTLRRREDELQTRFGLLTEHANTIPRHRIQLIDVQQTVLHRVFRQAAIKARTAGASQGGDSDTGHDWITPIVGVRNVATVLEQVQPELMPDSSDANRVEAGARLASEIANIFDGDGWRRVETRARRRVFAKWAVPVSLPMTWLAWQFWPWGLLAWGVLILVIAVHSHMLVRTMGYSLTTRALWFKSGWLDRTWRVVRYNKIQAVTLAESPFDRRHRMASVRLDTANAGIGRDAIVIPYLGREDAQEIFERLRTEAAGTAFHW